MDLVEPVKLRVLTLKDLDAITDIDESLLGTQRKDYWAMRLERTETSGVPSLAAEVGGRVIGFILGSASGWEYGIPDNIAWIDTLGVRKEYQKKGIARLLFREMFFMFKEVGVDTIYVLVSWRDWDLLKFFDKMGFKRGDMINLEMKI
ncbi:MAG: GNAT family N-acetyltransferase [Syntrophorhabdaceae bacterium]|nr:GNAT family N-acetyltransferase [Syntrophorhabdaceae bacterium]MDD4196114.1 GNAT family N-acetyltransferase [Syntrophorhabdaceae bacterium]HOC45831.1 GNAT family N-acetyltransferase [Syntrophorhabdaceae bacterium]